MNNESKLKKFANVIKPLNMDDLLELRDIALLKLNSVPKKVARESYMYKALLVLEDRMVELGVN